MNPGWIWAFGVLLELGLLASLVLAVIRERRALSRLAEALGQVEKSKPDDPRPSEAAASSIASTLPRCWRRAGAELERGMRGEVGLDEALLSALEEASFVQPWPALRPRLLISALLSLTVCLPASLALWTAAAQTLTFIATTKTLARPALYLSALEQIPAIFEPLRVAFSASAQLLAGALTLAALRWLWLRAEVRQAHFLSAALSAVTLGRPQAMLQNSAALARLLAPGTALGPAVFGAVALVGCLSTSVVLLVAAADVRASNEGPVPLLGLWPSPSGLSTQALADSNVPVLRAGRPIAGDLPLLVVSKDVVRIASAQILALREGEVPPEFPQMALPVGDILDGFRRGREPLDIGVLADQQLAFGTVRAILEHLSAAYGPARFHLVIARELPDSTGQRQKRPAALSLRILASEEPSPALILAIEAEELHLSRAGTSSQATISGSHWETTFRERAQKTTHTEGALTEAPASLSYGRYLAVLSALDGLCPNGRSVRSGSETSTDCGLPGVGLEFSLRARPQPKETKALEPTEPEE